MDIQWTLLIAMSTSVWTFTQILKGILDGILAKAGLEIAREFRDYVLLIIAMAVGILTVAASGDGVSILGDAVVPFPEVTHTIVTGIAIGAGAKFLHLVRDFSAVVMSFLKQRVSLNE